VIALRKPAVVGLTMAALGAGLLTAAAPAEATPAPTAGMSFDLGITTASSMVTAQGKLFIGTGNSVQVRSLTGQLISTVTGEMGVAQLLRSPDGSAVYAADAAGSAISMIDPATGNETGHWTVQACPTHLALSGGRLFYSYGCSGGPTGLASIDASTGGDQTDSGLSIGAALLAGTDGRLVTMVYNTVTSYSVSGATLTAGNSITVQDSGNLTMSPDGTLIALTSMDGYQLNQYDARHAGPVRQLRHRSLPGGGGLQLHLGSDRRRGRHQ
jgi:hypothetical protein